MVNVVAPTSQRKRPAMVRFTSGPAVIILTPLSSIPEFRCLDETTLTTDC
jgi:hypothetical protein